MFHEHLQRYNIYETIEYIIYKKWAKMNRKIDKISTSNPLGEPVAWR